MIEYLNSILSQDQDTIASRQLDEGGQGGDAVEKHQNKLRKLVFGTPATPPLQFERSLGERQGGNVLGWGLWALGSGIPSVTAWHVPARQRSSILLRRLWRLHVVASCRREPMGDLGCLRLRR